MKFIKPTLSIILSSILLINPLLAHHSAIAFDKSKTVTVTGVIARSVWRNPHMAINMNAEDDDGNQILWKIEGPGTTILSGQGFNKKMLMDATKNKEEITVVVHPLRSGKPGGLLQGITLANGDSFQVGEEYQDPSEGEQERIIPSLVEWTPPPEGETWQEREKNETRAITDNCKWCKTDWSRGT